MNTMQWGQQKRILDYNSINKYSTYVYDTLDFVFICIYLYLFSLKCMQNAKVVDHGGDEYQQQKLFKKSIF